MYSFGKLSPKYFTVNILIYHYKSNSEINDHNIYEVKLNEKFLSVQAFDLAWAAACKNGAESVKISVPNGKIFLVSPTEFGGPCKCRTITFQVIYISNSN